MSRFNVYLFCILIPCTNENFFIQSVVFIVSIGFDLFLSKGQAYELPFKGGICITDYFDDSRYSLLRCQNLTGKVVNDIHLTFSYAKDPNEKNIYKEKKFNVDFKDTANNDFWKPNGELGWTIWSGDLIIKNDFNFNTDLVRLNGYWTKDDVEVPGKIPEVDGYPKVPGPLPLLGIGVAYRFSRKLRQRLNAAGRL